MPSTVEGAPATAGRGRTKTSSSPTMASTTRPMADPPMTTSIMVGWAVSDSPKSGERNTAPMVSLPWRTWVRPRSVTTISDWSRLKDRMPDEGIARSNSPTPTTRTRSPRRATGTSTVTRVPSPRAERIQRSPPLALNEAATASSPTPRPDTSVARSRVVNPGNSSNW